MKKKFCSIGIIFSFMFLCLIELFQCNACLSEKIFADDGSEISWQITYEVNSGNFIGVPTTTYIQGVGMVLPTNEDISRAGFAFLGWTNSNDNSDLTYIREISQTDTGNKTFYAKWGYLTTDSDYEYESQSGKQIIKGIKADSTNIIALGLNPLIVLDIPKKIDGINITDIDDYSFNASSNAEYTFVGLDLTKATSLVRIGIYAFYGNENITTSLVIPNSVTTLGMESFGQCGFTGTLTLSNNLQSIGQSCFSGNDGFTGSLILPQSLNTLSGAAFYECSGFDGSLVFENNIGITSIENRVFYKCGFTGSLTIPSSIETIKLEAFYDSNFDGTLTFQNGSLLTRIGDGAFHGNASNAFSGTLVLPSSLEYIGSSAFSQQNLFEGELAFGSKLFGIGSNAFYNCQGFSSISFSDSNVGNLVIGNNAFQNANGISGELTIPDYISVINNSAFKNCTNITSVVFSGDCSLTSFYDSLFEGCSSLSSISIPEGITSIGNNCFYGCALSGNLIIPQGVTNLGAYAFSNNELLFGNLVIPNSVTNIGANCFRNCYGLTGSLTFIAGAVDTQHIRMYAFYGCAFSGDITFPNSIVEIGDYAFAVNSDNPENYNFNGVLTFEDGENAKTIGENAFNGVGISNNVLNIANVSQIGENAFKNISNISQFVLNSGISSMSPSSFDGKLLICNSKEIYDNYVQTYSIIASTFSYEGWANFITTNSLSGGGYSQYKLFNQPFTYEKVEGVWVKNENYRFFMYSNESMIEYLHIGFTKNPETNELMTVNSIHSQDCYASVFEIKQFKAYYNSVTQSYTITGFTGAYLASLTQEERENITISIPATYNDGLVVYETGTSYGYEYQNGVKPVTKVEGFGCDNSYYENNISLRPYESYMCTFKGLDFSNATNLTTISANAFLNCNTIEGELVLPASLINIESYAFYNCTGLSGELSIVKNIQNTRINNYGYGVTINGIMTRAFYNCGFSSISFEGGTNFSLTIESEAFANCSALTGNFTIPNRVISIEDSALKNTYITGDCTLSFEDLTIETPKLMLGEYTFQNCAFSGIVTLPDRITGVDSGCFDGCDNITQFRLENYYFSSSSYQFGNENPFNEKLFVCGSSFIERINVNSSWRDYFGIETTIRFYSDEYNVTYLNPSVETIRQNKLIYQNFKFEKVNGIWIENSNYEFPDFYTVAYRRNFYTTNDYYIDESAITAIDKNDKILRSNSYYTVKWIPLMFESTYNSMLDGYVLNSYTSGYLAALDNEIRNLNVVIPFSWNDWCGNGVKEVIGLAENAFNQNSNRYVVSSTKKYIIKTIDFSNATSLKTIGANCFQNCTEMTSETLFNNLQNLTIINNSAFSYCTSLTNAIVLPKCIERIGQRAFLNCTSISSLQIASDANVLNAMIGDAAFYNCTSLAGSLNIPNNFTYIGSRAFFECSGLNGTLTLPSTTCDIGESAFYNCSGLTGNLRLPSMITVVNSSTFFGCVNFVGDITIPKNVTIIYSSAFSNCEKITGLYFEDMSVLQTIYGEAFSNCSSIANNIILPNTITAIYTQAFKGCSFTRVDIPATITTLGENVFISCSNLNMIMLTGDNSLNLYISVANGPNSSNAMIKNFNKYMLVLTCEVEVEFDINYDSAYRNSGYANPIELKLMGRSYKYEKTDGVWAINDNYVLPNPGEMDEHYFMGFCWINNNYKYYLDSDQFDEDLIIYSYNYNKIKADWLQYNYTYYISYRDNQYVMDYDYFRANTYNTLSSAIEFINSQRTREKTYKMTEYLNNPVDGDIIYKSVSKLRYIYSSSLQDYYCDELALNNDENFVNGDIFIRENEYYVHSEGLWTYYAYTRITFDNLINIDECVEIINGSLEINGSIAGDGGSVQNFDDNCLIYFDSIGNLIVNATLETTSELSLPIMSNAVISLNSANIISLGESAIGTREYMPKDIEINTSTITGDVYSRFVDFLSADVTIEGNLFCINDNAQIIIDYPLTITGDLYCPTINIQHKTVSVNALCAREILYNYQTYISDPTPYKISLYDFYFGDDIDMENYQQLLTVSGLTSIKLKDSFSLDTKSRNIFTLNNTYASGQFTLYLQKRVFNITFYSQGNTNEYFDSYISYSYGDVVEMPDKTIFEREGYSVIGWFEKNNNYYYGNDGVPYDNILNQNLTESNAITNFSRCNFGTKYYYLKWVMNAPEFKDENAVYETFEKDYDGTSSYLEFIINIYNGINYSYKWFKSDTEYGEYSEFENANIYYIAVKNSNDSGYYKCEVTFTDGTQTSVLRSDAKKVLINKLNLSQKEKNLITPVIEEQFDISEWKEGAITPYIDQNISKKYSTITYQYKKLGTPDSEYSLTVPQTAGEYSVRAVLSGADNYNDYITSSVNFEIKSKASSTIIVIVIIVAIVLSVVILAVVIKRRKKI